METSKVLHVLWPPQLLNWGQANRPELVKVLTPTLFLFPIEPKIYPDLNIVFSAKFLKPNSNYSNNFYFVNSLIDFSWSIDFKIF